MSGGLSFKQCILKAGGYTGGKSTITSSHKIYKLSSNENILGCSPEIIQAQNNVSCHLYPDPQALPLKSAICEHYNGLIQLGQIMVANGGSELIDMIIRAFVEPEDEVMVTSPYFTPYKMFAHWSGAVIIDVPLVGEDYHLDVDAILQSITPKTKLLFLTSPNNPTGTVIDRDTFEQLMARLPDHVVVVYDEVYQQFATNPQYFTALEFVQKNYSIIGLNSFSKAYGLANIRLGYAYSTPAIAAYVNMLYRPFQINGITQQAGIAALRDKHWLDNVCRIITSERAWLSQELKRMNISFVPSEANFLLINCELKEEEEEYLLAQKGIMVRPTSSFQAPKHIRVTIGDREANEAFVKAYASIRNSN